MPRDELRPITFSAHAEQRLSERGVELEDARQMVRAGAWHKDGVCRFGEPKWYAQGSYAGQVLRLVFIETTDEAGEAALDILHVVTVITPRRER